jgi:hypothetical protein
MKFLTPDLNMRWRPGHVEVNIIDSLLFWGFQKETYGRILSANYSIQMFCADQEQMEDKIVARGNTDARVSS